MITSVDNARIRNIIQLNQKTKARRSQGLFVAEGIKMYQEAPVEWIRQVYVSESFGAPLSGKPGSVPVETVSDAVFRRMTDTVAPQGILTVLRIPSWSFEPDAVRDGTAPLYLILEEIQDPGNLGTILRTAEGAGVDGVFLTRGCVDPTSPKVIRSTMGSVYRVPFFHVEDVDEARRLLSPLDVRLTAAHLEGKLDYDCVSYTGGTAFLIGNEARGLSIQAARAADVLIRIPMQGQLESLNASVAAAVLMYEAFRQRRHG